MIIIVFNDVIENIQRDFAQRIAEPFKPPSTCIRRLHLIAPAVYSWNYLMRRSRTPIASAIRMHLDRLTC